jgi:transposase
VSVWVRQLAEVNCAVGKLKAKPMGPLRRLDALQCEALSRLLVAGALQAGFATELWTVKRVRSVIAHEFGVEYSPTGCWELLRDLGFSPQKPEKRATQRNEPAIAQWKVKTWPGPKNARCEGRTIVFKDESGLSERCPVTTTWAKRGHTPVIQQSFSWSQMSAIAGLSWWRVCFRVFAGAVMCEQVVEFLGALKRKIARKLLVIWDGAAIQPRAGSWQYPETAESEHP